MTRLAFFPILIATICPTVSCNLEPIAITRMRAKCDKEDVHACFRLAKTLAGGALVDVDMDGAQKVRKRGVTMGLHQCNKQGNQVACYILGSRHYAGTPDGMPINRVKALEYFTKACKGGSERGCAMKLRMGREDAGMPF